MRPEICAFFAVLVVLLAGCLADETRLSASASGPYVSHTWAYDGIMNLTQGSISINVVDESNTGRVEANWTDGGVWSLNWTNFSEAPDKPYQDGGVVSNIDAHGDSGQGDALIPRVHYVMGGWGMGRLVKDGQDFTDPLTGLPDLKLHFMVLPDGIRQPSNLMVQKSDGSTSYDPNSSSDGMTHAGHKEILLLLTSTQPGVPGRTEYSNFTGTVNSPAYARMHPFPAPEAVSNIKCVVGIVGAPPAVTARLTVQLKDQRNATVASRTLGGEGQVQSVTLESTRPMPGQWGVFVQGSGVNVNYQGMCIIKVAARPAYFTLLSFEEGVEFNIAGPKAK